MPEGDTVWRAAQSLDRALSGQQGTVDLRVPRLATAGFTALAGATVARGKHLLTRFDNDLTLHTHLKMEGTWHVYAAGDRWRRPAHEARVVIDTERWQAVGFALGVVELGHR